MAFVKSLEKDLERRVNSAHPTQLVCRYFAGEDTSNPIIQINSYGSQDRQNPDKLSQTLQFDNQSAHELFNALHEIFGFETK